MFRNFSSRRVIGAFLLDWFGTLLMLLAAASLRIYIGNISSGTSLLFNNLEEPDNGWLAHYGILLPELFLLVSLIWPFFFYSFSVYDGRSNRTYIEESFNVVKAIIFSTFTLAGLLFLTFRETSRGFFLLFFVLDMIFLLSGRTIWYIYRVFRPRDRGSSQNAAVIIGAGTVGKNAVEEILKFNRDAKLLGFFDDKDGLQDKTVSGLPILGALEDLPAYIQEHRVTDALIALPLYAYTRLIDIVRILQEQSVRVHIVPDLFALSFHNSKLDSFNNLTVIDLGEPGISGAMKTVKRLSDFAVTLALLVFLFPFFIVIAALIKIDSKGPVLFFQERVGVRGQLFRMIKFRTMFQNADEILQDHLARHSEDRVEWDEFQKLKEDPRITRVGRFLRHYSLDELPQLINIFKGEMSLVGPRPFFPEQLDLYGEAVNNYIHFRPGITGLWQISGRNLVSFHERIRWDEYYVRNWSFKLDITILFRTILVVLGGKGAY